MIKFLSYILPITKTKSSKHNRALEITWHNGKKYLNSKNANYSYGSLQKILKFGLETIPLKPVNSILLLGLGGGSVIQTLRQDFGYHKHITAVEIDPIVIAIAEKEFNITSDEQLEIVCEDALDYMANNTQMYDLIIIDLFIDTDVPEPFLTRSFWETVINANNKTGSILFNASVTGSEHEAIKKTISFLDTHYYKTQIHHKVNGTNTLIIARATDHS